MACTATGDFVDEMTGEVQGDDGPVIISTTGKRNSRADEWDDEDGESLITRETEDFETPTINYEKGGMKPALNENGEQLDCPDCPGGKLFLVNQNGTDYRVCGFALRGPDSSCSYSQEIPTPKVTKAPIPNITRKTLKGR